MVKKRDYSRCFMCGSQDLGCGGKRTFCLTCKEPQTTCYHKRLEYFSICKVCIKKAPSGPGDGGWIVEKQRELELKDG